MLIQFLLVGFFLVQRNCVPATALGEPDNNFYQDAHSEDVNTLIAINLTRDKRDADERWTSYCDPQLGCLTLTPAWFNAVYRPVNLEPWPRNKIMTKFSLYTREAPNGVYLYANNTKSISGSKFKASRPTKFLTHGFLNTGNEANFVSITKNLLKTGDYNVIRTQWGPGAGPLPTDYFQAVANTRVVGLEIAFLVNTMVKSFGVLTKNVHLIGHSLGAQISGYAGQRIKNLGRITGLDPAGPFFTNMDPVVRLDPTDADFVDVLHTNAGVFGTSQPMGHIDIYANDGGFQPGCSNTTSLTPFWKMPLSQFNALVCSHGRAVEFFSDSLISSCQAVAYECADYNTFKQGNCFSCGVSNTRCVPVGIQANLYPNKTRTNVKLYFTTSSTSPFCQYQYVIQTSIASNVPKTPSAVYGTLSVSVKGANSGLLGRGQSTTFKQGQKQNFLMTSSMDFGKVSSLTLTWTPNSDPQNTLYCFVQDCTLYVANVTISSLNRYPESGRLAYTFNGCPASASSKYIAIPPKSTAVFIARSGSLSCK